MMQLYSADAQANTQAVTSVWSGRYWNHCAYCYAGVDNTVSYKISRFMYNQPECNQAVGLVAIYMQSLYYPTLQPVASAWAG